MFDLETLIDVVEYGKTLRCPDCLLKVICIPQFDAEEDESYTGTWIVIEAHDATCPWLNAHPELLPPDA